MGALEELKEKVRFLEEELKRLRNEKSAARERLNQLREQLLIPRSLDSHLTLISEAVVDAFNADFARVWVTRPGDLCEKGCRHAHIDGPEQCSREACLHLLASSGRYTRLDGGHQRVPLGFYKIGRVASGEDAQFVTNDVTRDPRVHDNAWAAELGLVSFAGYRLLSNEGAPIGVLALFSKDRIDEERSKLLRDLANSTAQVLQTAAAKEALRKSRAQLQAIMDHSPALISVKDLKGNILLNNKNFSVLRGPPPEEYIDRNIYDLFPFEVADALWKNDQEALSRERPVEAEEVVQHKDGSWHTYLTVKFPLYEDGAPFGVGSISTDITDRKREGEEQQRLQVHLQEARKTEAIATLAGGVAHQYNNALSGIIGNIELLRMEVDEGEPITRYVTPMKEAAQRMARLTNQLLAYARGGRYRPCLMAFSKFVRDTLPLLGHTVATQVVVDTDLPRSVGSVEADGTQMQMLCSALLSNASEAIIDEGRIQISTSVVEIDEATANASSVKPGAYICLSVADDGIGMDEEEMSRVFEPFYTTKFQGRGLGMAAVYGIVRNHGGFVSIESKQGRGTMVRVFLPQAEASADSSPPQNNITEGSGTVLVVEDEESVLEVATQILRRLGYEVLQARCGGDALEIYRANQQQVVVVLLDLLLPDMSADDVFDGLKAANSEVLVLLTSGYTIDNGADAIIARGARGFVQKPFGMKDLSRSLKTALDV